MTRLRRAFAPAREQKTSRAGQLLAIQAFGQPHWTSRNESALAREGYERNAICHRCVRMIAEAVAAIPWLIYEGDAEAADHPLHDLLARPNPFDSGVGFIETICANLMLYGNAYVEAATLDGVLREFYALRPDRMSVVPGRNGWPSAYVYRAGADETRYALRGDGLEPVLHIRLFNPFDDYYGLAPLAAAQMALDTHNAASYWNKALLDNSARPSGALVYARPDGAHLTDEQFTRLKEELEENFSGAFNAGRPLLLEGGLDWKALSLSPKDMDFSQTRDSAAREIALTFGVPPLLLGLPGDNTYANFQEANRAFWRQTVIPLVGRLHKSFAAWLTPAYGALRFEANLDRIDALAEERALEWRRIGAADFLTLDERREAAGYGPAPRDGAAQGFVAQQNVAKDLGGQDNAALELRYSPDQPRAPAGSTNGGQWVPAGGGGSGGGKIGGGGRDTTQRTSLAMNIDPNIANDPGGLLHDVQYRPGRTGRIFPGPGGPTYEQLDRLDATREEAVTLMTRVRARDPAWRPGAVLTNPADVESDIARYESWRNDARARLDELSPGGIGDNNPPEPFRIFPNLLGRRAKISERDNDETRRSLYRENQSADIFFAAGHSVEQSPKVAGQKNPDFRIDGTLFDNYAPRSVSLRNIRGLIQQKINENQAKSIILNLRDTPVTVQDIDNYLLFYPIDGLDKLWIVDRWGEIHYLRDEKR
jgi:HK97 family phage portal protein